MSDQRIDVFECMSMSFERFCQLWDELVIVPITATNSHPNCIESGGMSEETNDALIAYSHGDRSRLEGEIFWKLNPPYGERVPPS